MSSFSVIGGRPINGRLKLQGAKNGALPILAATVLCRGRSNICNCPELSDTKTSLEILSDFGCQCSFDGYCATVCSDGVNCARISEQLMGGMRSSIIYMGALLARCGRAEVYFPGGCELGSRPIDLHLSSLRLMGATIEQQGGCIVCGAKDGLHGAYIDLPIASVGATENIILAAVTAQGRTVIRNAAKEPEIVDLCSFLRRAGAMIDGDGAGTVVIDGVSRLNGCEYTVLPDRIAGITYLTAAAMTGGSVEIYDCVPEHMRPAINYLAKSGCSLKTTRDSIRLSMSRRPDRFELISTHVYPGFPTDAQPMLLAMSTICDGTSMFVENIFNSRYRYIDSLLKMGAEVRLSERVAVVDGVERLHGAKVHAPDLRGGAAILLAALSAEGETQIEDISHIERGYSRIDECLKLMNADIKRVN